MLGSISRHLLCCVIERFADVALGTREGVGDDAGGLVGEVFDAILALLQQLTFTALESAILARTPVTVRLLAAERRETLVAPLDRGFEFAARDEHGSLAVCGGEEGVDTKVYAEGGAA